jgi:citrate lyase synthetase
MAARNPKIQIAFRYRTVDSASGVTRKTVKRLAEYLGVDETQAIHQALHDLAAKILPQYEQDEGPVSAAQVRQIKKRIPQGSKRSVRSSLFEMDSAK